MADSNETNEILVMQRLNLGFISLMVCSFV